MSKDTGGPATAHEAFRRALEEAMRQLEPTIYQIESVRDRADQILKEPRNG